MKVNLAYIAPIACGFQVENYSDLVNMKLVNDLKVLKDSISKSLIDVVIIDSNVSSSFEEIRDLCADKDDVKIYFLANESSLESLTWAINQPWIDKIISSDGNDFALTDEVLKIAVADSELLMTNKQLVQDNRELEFVISQMMLVE